ncbi:hypothetical protein Lesp02_32760 [Lentzea sp. NBRC 105346]|uniref:radical SAM protein n=1 Tax=Lentzea sp. NBRC 105346 TaxID=3032205 RepID=UPI0024A49F5B|nr:radical SAM protein [Lentzea sp. NBRC 105346]GLZ31088.1 hypothetical protein Lesp02_32760 [Lentzea sp. NBRC 105346]
MDITWEVAYARLSHERMLRTADALISMRPDTVTLSGGEPLSVPGLFEILERFRDAGVGVVLHTGGQGLHPSMVGTLHGLCARIVIGIDSWAHAMQALHMLDVGAAMAERHAEFGLDAHKVHYGFDRLEEFLAVTAAGLPNLAFVAVGDAVTTDHVRYLQALAPQGVRVTRDDQYTLPRVVNS